jgi:hypothetical protein
VTHRPLRDHVGRQRERQPARERPFAIEIELSQPQERQAAGRGEGQEDEDVPRSHRAEQRVQRPEEDPEGPTREVRSRLDLRLEAVGVEPRRRATFELMAGEPELPDRLQVVAGRHLAACRQALSQEAVIRVPERRPGRDDACPEVDGQDEGYKACAAARMASRSGTSVSS